jgi:hypothetical protein
LPQGTHDRWQNLAWGHEVSFYDKAVEAFKPYKFVIAMENKQRAGYFTEKIVNAALANAVPVYWGAQDMGEYFNPKSFVQCKFPAPALRMPKWCQDGKNSELKGEAFKKCDAENEVNQLSPLLPRPPSSLPPHPSPPLPTLIHTDTLSSHHYSYCTQVLIAKLAKVMETSANECIHQVLELDQLHYCITLLYYQVLELDRDDAKYKAMLKVLIL